MTANLLVVQNMFEEIKCYVDTDHAGWAPTKRSTTGLADDAWKALCETREQCPVDDCVVQWRVGVVRLGTR